MRCEDLERTIALWEAGKLSKEGALAAAEHIGTCGDCSRRFGGILPLLRREAGLPVESGSRENAVPDIAGPVMERLAVRRPRFKSARGGMPVFVPIAAILVAALVLPLTYRAFSGRQTGNEVVVRFVIDLPEARSVSLVGDFSDWKPDVYRLGRKDETGTWEIELRLPKGKVYTYNFVVDGADWIPDPKAPCKVGDGFGGESSLLQL